MTDNSRFFTKVETDGPKSIAHGMKIWTIGSCFADEIGSRMERGLLDVAVNPFGTLYNPLSIAATLCRAMDGKQYSRADLFEHEGLWHSFDFHSSFSGPAADMVLRRINSTMSQAKEQIPQLQYLMITLGSAHMFILKETGEVVANCHKQPARIFEERDLSVDECVEALGQVLRSYLEAAPHLRVILTVSPIRHKAYGFHADRLSKATLLLAADRLTKELPEGRCFYFPAYEIMNDELRDYRFYASDMIHPSETAADHIYARFREAWCSDRCIRCADMAGKLMLRLNHRVRTGASAEISRRFYDDTLRMAREICRRYPEATGALSTLLNSHGLDLA